MSGKTNDEIIKSLLDLAFYKSSGSTSLSNVADGIHIKKASIYNHFASREDLIAQTIKNCGQYISEINFIPDDIETVTKKYSAETVLKGIVNRFFKMHEKSPLFQIYTFVQSEKYFYTECMDIVNAEKEKLIEQTELVLNSLVQNGKLSLEKEKIHFAAVWFCNGVLNILSSVLLERKKIIIENPKSGNGELFTLQQDDSLFNEVNVMIENFVSLIG